MIRNILHWGADEVYHTFADSGVLVSLWSVVRPPVAPLHHHRTLSEKLFLTRRALLPRTGENIVRIQSYS